MKRKSNYHGHTYLCGHAGGSPIEYVTEAIKLNYTELGISEHAPMPNLINNNSRLKDEDYNLYFNLMDEARNLAKQNNLVLYTGFEIEWFNFLDVYPKYLKDVSYLVLGQHYIVKNGEYVSTYALETLEDIKIYVNTLIEASRTGYFNLIAHPELCFYNIKEPTKEMYNELRKVVKVAKELNIPLELNANGIRRSFYEENNKDSNNFRYPRTNFLEIVSEEGATMIISSDNHSIKDFDDWAIKEAYKLVDLYNIKLVENLKMDYYKQK